MTGPRATHPEFEELISASLSGELNPDERRRLDAHLDGCERCRATLAAFADNRRIVSGLRHAPAPRDLHARVRSGIERGRFGDVPWYRRPAVLVAGIGGGLAAVAGALLAVVILADPQQPVGQATPSPSAPAATASATPDSTFPTGPTPSPDRETPLASPSEPVATSSPAESPSPEPEPDVYLAVTGPFDNRALTVVDGQTDELITEADTPSGPPIAAELSPDGQWVAYLTRVGEKGTHEIRVTRIAEGTPSDDPDALPPVDSPVAVGDTLVLGESLSGDPFAEQLFWSSPRGVYIAFTIVDPESGATDVWIFEPGLGEARRMTDSGDAYAASWIPGGDEVTARLWISVAAERPTSYLHGFHVDAGGDGNPIDPTENALAEAEGVFQPLLNANGRFAIYWDGAMQPPGDGGGSWRFVSGAQPYLAEHVFESEQVFFTDERSVFRDLTVGRDGFASASITWGEDGDAYAIWGVRWTGTDQSAGDEDPYPDEARVYLSRATDPRGMTRTHALDRGDLPEGWAVVDVKVSPTGEHLVITVAEPRAGELDAPTARLLLVDRNTGNEPDDVEELRAEEGFWFGPAGFAEPPNRDR